MSVEELLPIISVGLTKSITKVQIFSNSIELDHLKRIDKVFNKGIHYYLDPKSPNSKLRSPGEKKPRWATTE